MQDFEDSDRIDWLAKLFVKHWDGTIGRDAYWDLPSSYRHTVKHMRGNTFREAIDKARQTERNS